MPARFPFLAASSSHGDALLMPLLPLELSFKGGHVVQAVGLIDSGARSTFFLTHWALG